MSDIGTWTTAFNSVATPFLTAALVVLTGVLAVETKRMAAASQQPHVVTIIEPNRWSLNLADLVVQNTGNSPAYDITIAFDPPLKINRHGEENDAPFKRLSVLLPSGKLSSNLGYIEPYLKKSYNITVSWKRNPNSSKRETQIYNFDMADYNGLGIAGGDPIVKIAEHLKEIREDWRNVANGFRHLKTDIYDSADREANEARQEAIMRKQMGKEDDLDI